MAAWGPRRFVLAGLSGGGDRNFLCGSTRAAQVGMFGGRAVPIVGEIWRDGGGETLAGTDSNHDAGMKRFTRLPWVLLSRAEITSSAKLVWSVLMDRQGNNGHCWPSVRKVALDCGLSIGAAHRALAELETVGLIKVDRSRRPSSYTVQQCDVMFRAWNTDDVPSTEHDVPPVERDVPSTEPGCSVLGIEPDPGNRSRNQRVCTHTKEEGKDLKKQEADGGLTVDVAVSVFGEVYRQAKGADPDRVGDRERGRLRKFLDENHPDLSTWRARLRCAAGIDGERPWPFKDTGELSLDAVTDHWGKLGDAMRGSSSRFRTDGSMKSPPGKYANLKVVTGYVGTRAN